MALYLAQKAIRNDLWYWVPINGAAGMAVSLLARLLVKVITDYTGVVHFRNQCEMGPHYWTINMFMAIAAAFVSVKVNYSTIEEGGEAIAEETAWTLASALGGAWVAVFLVFLYLMKRKYRATFYSLQTIKDIAMTRFISEDNSDEVKSTIVEFNRHLWLSTRSKVREWFSENWERWEEEKPLWFTQLYISCADDDLLPPHVLERQKLAGGGERHRSSLIRRDSRVAPAPEPQLISVY